MQHQGVEARRQCAVAFPCAVCLCFAAFSVHEDFLDPWLELNVTLLSVVKIKENSLITLAHTKLCICHSILLCVFHCFWGDRSKKHVRLQMCISKVAHDKTC